MTWFEAKDHCRGEGGMLVEINSEEENAALVEESNRRGYNKMHFWIGLSDVDNEGDWRHASNGLEPSYLNWDVDDGQPNNKGDNEGCARLRIGPEYAAKDMWSDTRCDKAQNNPYSLHALCEFDQSEQRFSTEGGSNKWLIAKGC